MLSIFRRVGNCGSDQCTNDKRSVNVVIRRGITIVNQFGLCARPAAEFVCAAKGFRSQIWLVKEGDRFSATGIIDVLSAGLNCDETATIEANGPMQKKQLSN